MKHATPAALDQLTDLLNRLRRFDEFTERRHGVFYKSSGAFIHFHEDPAGLFAHIKLPSGWERIRIQTRAERQRFLKKVRAAIQPVKPPAR